MMKAVKWLVLIGGVLALTSTAQAQQNEVDALTESLLKRVTVWVNPHNGHIDYIIHCRQAEGGCEARIRHFAELFVRVGHETGVDPTVLAALAFRESGLNPFALGQVRHEGGIMQINPCRRDLPADVRAFVGSCGADDARTQRFRDRCAHDPTACQEPLVRYSARMLAGDTARCHGSMPRALTAYNSGYCDDSDYAHYVLLEADRIAQGKPSADGASAGHYARLSPRVPRGHGGVVSARLAAGGHRR